VNGESITTIQDLYLAVAGSRPGIVRVALRDGRTLELPIPQGDEAKLALAKSLIPASAPVVGTRGPGHPGGPRGLRAVGPRRRRGREPDPFVGDVADPRAERAPGARCT
jgi:hypothetical protein